MGVTARRMESISFEAHPDWVLKCKLFRDVTNAEDYRKLRQYEIEKFDEMVSQVNRPKDPCEDRLRECYGFGLRHVHQEISMVDLKNQTRNYPGPLVPYR